MYDSLTTDQLQPPHWEIWTVGAKQLTDWHATGVFVPCWRLYWCDQPGQASVRASNALSNLGPDRLTLIAPNTYIEATLHASVRHMWIHFSAGKPYDALTNWIGEMALGKERQQGAADLAKAIEWCSGRVSRVLLIWITEVIANAMRCVPEHLLTHPAVDPRVAEALQLVRTDLQHTPATVARRLKIGPTTLNRLFHRYLGCTPGRVIGLLRLERSRHMLGHTDYGLDTVADICGYCDRFHMSRRFSETYGVAPAAYRKLCSNRRGKRNRLKDLKHY
ncbi:MAG: helix-turn-helix domain-containing protein [Candidatus Pacebacteria bacterium]|nr:helix-turn-helix domain-containing protein [Candidatus Paceibacterota bacterium]